MRDISLSRGRSTHARRGRALAPPLAAVVLGALAGVAAVAIAAGTAAGDANDRPSLDPGRVIDAAHVPPLLTTAGEVVDLRYDVYCTAPDGDPDSGAPCDAGGTVYARAGEADAWEAFRLRRDASAEEGRYVTRLPERIAAARDGFSYYAVLRNELNGVSMTLPAGGSAAPQRSTPLRGPTVVPLGRHEFGHTVAPSERLFSAAWGSGAREVGLEGGRQTTPIGPAAFDVDARGRVALLDQVNRRVLHVAPGRPPGAVPLGVDGTLADMSVGRDGAIYVLESTGRAAGDPPLLRAFDADGRPTNTVELAERTAAQVRVGPDGPVVKQYPSELWRPTHGPNGPLTKARQLASGRAGRPLGDGREIVVLHRGTEVRVALGRPGDAGRSWLITSDTPLGDVQLAEPYGSGAVVVLRVYTDAADEFVALVLGPRGVERRLRLASEDWAETAPLTRFRLAASALYRLGSSPAGVHVDRFDLEVAR